MAREDEKGKNKQTNKKIKEGALKKIKRLKKDKDGLSDDLISLGVSFSSAF